MSEFNSQHNAIEPNVDLIIGPGMAVTMHFAIKLQDGAVVDSTFGGEPASFVVGDQNLLEGFEQVLFGLVAGDHHSVVMESEQAFGPHNPDNVQSFPKTAFDVSLLGVDELKEGLLLSFSDVGDNELPGVVQSIDDNYVVVDFNHPLAGRDLVFEVEIISVTPAVSH